MDCWLLHLFGFLYVLVEYLSAVNSQLLPPVKKSVLLYSVGSLPSTGVQSDETVPGLAGAHQNCNTADQYAAQDQDTTNGPVPLQHCSYRN